MTIAESKVTSQGQISVPAQIRKILGVTPGSFLEWIERDGEIIVRRAAKFDSADIHSAIFEDAPSAKPIESFDAGIEALMRSKFGKLNESD